MQQTTQLSSLKSNPLPSPDIKVGFLNAASFELMQRAARMMAHSTLVPAAYQSVITKLDRYGQVVDRRENPNAISNCVIVLNMSARMNADPLMIAQNLYIVEGRPSWSSQWIIAAINSCGRFSPLRFEIKELGEKNVEYTTYAWVNKERTAKTEKIKIKDKVCIAWAIERETGERIESPPVSIEMAVKEGWYTKNGSKWQTMEDVMLRYRTASFFGKLYAPELLMGLQSTEEIHDTLIEAVADDKGVYQTNIDDLKPRTEQAPQPTGISSEQPEIVDPETGEILSASQDNEQTQAEDETKPEPPPSPTATDSGTEAKPAQQAATRKTKQLDLG